MFNEISHKKSKILVLLIIIYVFFVSSNIAWLNPNPALTNDEANKIYKDIYSPGKAYGVYKINEKIPLFWQYNADSGLEILTAAYFPKIFETYSTRIDRPTYPIIMNLFGKLIGKTIQPFKILSPLERTGIAYILFKFIIYLSSAYLMLNILGRFKLDNNISLLAILITYLHAHSITYATTFHTTELQFITPIIGIYLFLNIKDKYSIKKNIIYSIIAGCLMLAKPNYAIYLTIIAFSLYYRYFKEILISFVFHLLPFLIYLYYLSIIGIDYYNYGIQSQYGQLSWIYYELILNINEVNEYNSFGTIIFKILMYIYYFFNMLIKYFNIWIFLFLISLYINYKNNILKKDLFIFSIVFIISCFIQCFVAKRYIPYMVSDISILHNTGEVFFVTGRGLCSYRANATRSMDKFDNVMVFPNPVPKDFWGEIVISGLKDNTNVKIRIMKNGFKMEVL